MSQKLMHQDTKIDNQSILLITADNNMVTTQDTTHFITGV